MLESRYAAALELRLTPVQFGSVVDTRVSSLVRLRSKWHHYPIKDYPSCKPQQNRNTFSETTHESQPDNSNQERAGVTIRHKRVPDLMSLTLMMS